MPGEEMRRVVLDPVPGGRLRSQAAPVPEASTREVLVKTLATGIDGTDEEIVEGAHGEPPQNRERMVMGHECLGRVVHAPPSSGLDAGDLVVPLVRHGCGGCDPCAHAAPDLCPNDRFMEHGIKGLDGFMQDYWTDTPESLVKAPRDLGILAVLTEPLSIVEKAFETARFIQQRIPWFMEEQGFRGKRALVAGTGSLGSLGALLLRHEGMKVWAMDRHGNDTHVANTLRAVGATHVNARKTDVLALAEDVNGFDLVIEATGAPKVLFRTMQAVAPNGVLCALGVPGEGEPVPVEADHVMRRMVTGNQVMFGSVNSNRRHFDQALRDLRAFRARWGDELMHGLLTHRFQPEAFAEAFAHDDPDMIKKVIIWDEEGL